MELEAQVKKLEEAKKAVEAERDELKSKIQEADKAKAIAETKAELDKALTESKLPEAARQRIRERFAKAENMDGVTETIKAEEDYVASIRESGNVKNLGPKVTASKPEDKEALVESFKRLGMDEQAAKIAAEGK